MTIFGNDAFPILTSSEVPNVEQRPVPKTSERLREVAWSELFPGLLLLGALKPAREVPKLLLAAVALLITVAGWRGLGYVFSGDPQTALVIEQLGVAPWGDEARRALAAETAPVGDWLRHATDSLGLPGLLGPRDVAWLTKNPILDSWVFLSRPVRQLFDGNLNVSSVALLATCAIWTVVVWGLFGGAICRIAAVQLTRRQRVGMVAALKFSAGRWTAYVWATVLPLFLVAAVVGGVSLVSWLARGDVGLAGLALFWPVALAGGFVAAVVMLGLLFGWPLLWSAVGAERADAFDAIGRMYAYVYQRPLHYLAYTFCAALYGILGWLLVAGFAAAAVYLTIWAASWAAGAQRMAELAADVPPEAIMIAWPLPAATAPTQTSPAANTAAEVAEPAFTARRFGVGALTFWVAGVKLLALGFGISYFWTASTAIYLLMRLATDNRQLDEVYLEDDRPRGLPSLSKDEAGVPQLAEGAAAHAPAAAPNADPTAAAKQETAADAKEVAPPQRGSSTNDAGGLDLTESRAENDGG